MSTEADFEFFCIVQALKTVKEPLLNLPWQWIKTFLPSAAFLSSFMISSTQSDMEGNLLHNQTGTRYHFEILQGLTKELLVEYLLGESLSKALNFLTKFIG